VYWRVYNIKSYLRDRLEFGLNDFKTNQKNIEMVGHLKKGES
jgi:hypothetical protein